MPTPSEPTAAATRPDHLSVCSCGAPLIGTFHWRGKEWICLECGLLYEFFGCPSAETTDKLWERFEALRGEWDEWAQKLLTPGAKHEDCPKCWGKDADRQHIDHATAVEKADDAAATAWLLVRTHRG